MLYPALPPVHGCPRRAATEGVSGLRASLPSACDQALLERGGLFSNSHEGRAKTRISHPPRIYKTPRSPGQRALCPPSIDPKTLPPCSLSGGAGQRPGESREPGWPHVRPTLLCRLEQVQALPWAPSPHLRVVWRLCPNCVGFWADANPDSSSAKGPLLGACHHGDQLVIMVTDRPAAVCDEVR